MKKPDVVVQEDGRAGAIVLTPAEICEILAALHSRRTERAVQLIDKLTKAVENEQGTIDCP